MSTQLEKEIREALEEARIMECARDKYDVDNILKTASKLSGADFEDVLRLAKTMSIQ